MKIKPVIQLILVLLSMQAIAQQPVTEANYRLADNWTIKKQFQRIRNIWTVPVWRNNGELFYYKHVEHDTVYVHTRIITLGRTILPFMVYPIKKTDITYL